MSAGDRLLLPRPRRLAAMPAGWRRRGTRPGQAVTSHPRYRAWERRGILTAVRAGAATSTAIQLVESVLLGPGQPAILLVNLPAAAAALALLWVLRQRGEARRRPVVAAFFLGWLVLVSCLVQIGLAPGAGPRTAGYVPIILVASALFVPWTARWHVPWLVAVLAAVALFDLGRLAGPAAVGAVGALFPMALAGATISLIGHALLAAERRRAFLVRMQLRGLNHTARQQRRELQALADQLEAVARRDPLTGIGNRLRLDEDVGALRRAGGPGAGPTTAVLVDLDHFKDYNDALGHLAGDAVLREVAWTIATSLRPGDRLYRFGGEEFVVLVDGADEPEAVAIAERLREMIEAIAIPHPANPPWGVVTVSAGVAQVDIGEGRADDWLREADARLYRAKAAGRNRIVAGSSSAGEPAGGGPTAESAA